jgi:hypothetical protein
MHRYVAPRQRQIRFEHAGQRLIARRISFVQRDELALR